MIGKRKVSDKNGGYRPSGRVSRRHNAKLGHEALLNVSGRLPVQATSWEEPGSALDNVIKAVGKLSEAGHYGPYALAASSALFGRMIRVLGNTDRREIDQIKAGSALEAESFF